jgi:hypothetical protein
MGNNFHVLGCPIQRGNNTISYSRTATKAKRDNIEVSADVSNIFIMLHVFHENVYDIVIQFFYVKNMWYWNWRAFLHIMGKHSFQTHLGVVHKYAPLMWIILLFYGSRDTVHIAAVHWVSILRNNDEIVFGACRINGARSSLSEIGRVTDKWKSTYKICDQIEQIRLRFKYKHKSSCVKFVIRPSRSRWRALLTYYYNVNLM